METDVIITGLILACAVLGVAAVGFAVSWIRARERAIRAEHERRILGDIQSRRFDRLDQAVDAMALEVERIAEIERFAVQALGDAPRKLPRESESRGAPRGGPNT
jgi:hypothetical protein